jgi:hypothetical protein
MNKLIALVYPSVQTTVLEQQLSSRLQVDKLINPTFIDVERYDKILVLGSKASFEKASLDKISILSEKHPDVIEWVEDVTGEASRIILTTPTRSSLGAFQTGTGDSSLELYEGLKVTLLFQNKKSVLSEFRMLVNKGGEGLANLTFFDADSGGKLLRTYDLHITEFVDGWFCFKLPNPIFNATKKLAVSFEIARLVGSNPVWKAHSGWSDHVMLLNQTKSDLVCCFETL